MKLLDRLKLRTSEPIPHWCGDFFSQFGKNSYGENIWRVVWGWDRTMFVRTPEGDFEMPIYSLEADWNLDRWILEKWVKDPKPQPDGRFGYFEFCHILQTDKKVFMPLERDYLALIITIITKGREDFNFERNKQAIKERMAAADAKNSEAFDQVWSEASEDVHRHIAMKPSVLDDVPMNYGVEKPKIGIHQSSDIAKELRFRKIN